MLNDNFELQEHVGLIFWCVCVFLEVWGGGGGGGRGGGALVYPFYKLTVASCKSKHNLATVRIKRIILPWLTILVIHCGCIW